MKTANPGIILGLSPTGLYAARELSAAGIKLWGIDKEFGPAAWSKAFRAEEGFGCSIISDVKALLDSLIEFSQTQSHKPVIIPTSDYFIEFVLLHYAELSQYCYLASGYAGKASTFLDKMKFSNLCIEHGIDAPKVYLFDSKADLQHIVSELSFPCILKPQFIHLAKHYLKGKKVVVVNSEQDLLNVADGLPQETGAWFVQEVIPGTESNITLLAGYRSRQGEVISFTARKVRQYPPGFGSASLVVSERCEETRALSIQLVEALGFQGIFGAEFKRDPRDNKLKVIEINPRPTLWFHISRVSGVAIAQTAYFDLVGETYETPTPQNNQVLWRYYLKDLYSKMFYKTQPEFVFAAPDIKPTYRGYKQCFPVFDVVDPKPMLAEFYVFFRKLLKRVF